MSHTATCMPALESTVQSVLEEARRVLELEEQAVAKVVSHLDESFFHAVEALLACPYQVVVSGIGKSGIIARKISATLASTGTPSHFLHPAEALHGDLGRMRSGDVALLLSYSGSTSEVVALANLCRNNEMLTISMCKSRCSPLAVNTDISLTIGEIAEACHHNLAPTCTTTAMLALGDALAIVLSSRRGFSESDFHRLHPGGKLGRVLSPLSTVLTRRVGRDVFTSFESDSLKAVLLNANALSRRAGAILVTDNHGALSGIFTDADLRRLLASHGTEALQMCIKDVMTASPKALQAAQTIRDALELFRVYQIDEIPVVSDGNIPIGILDVQDLIAMDLLDRP